MLKKIKLLVFPLGVGLMMIAASGCSSKLARIDSAPGLAEIYVNSEYVGKTPLYYRFRDRWYPWPFERSDNYTVVAKFEPGYRPEEQFFFEESPWPEISYIPDEMLLELKPVDAAGETGPE